MKKLRVAACDDDRAALDIIVSSLKSVFAQHGVDAEVSVYGSADALAADMGARGFDLLLLDIDMPGTDGISFARTLRQDENRIDIIYISNREDLVFDSLRVAPCGFIRKSRFLEDMSSIVDTYVSARPGHHNTPRLVVQTREGVLSIPLDKLIYIEGARKTQLAHVLNQAQPSPLHKSMQELDAELSPQGFLRVHKGYLVNYCFIQLIEDTDILLTTGVRVPLSRRKLPEVKDRFMELMQNNGAMIF